eukprot:6185855-Pleurochrysis_carterae.AAC.3
MLSSKRSVDSSMELPPIDLTEAIDINRVCDAEYSRHQAFHIYYPFFVMDARDFLRRYGDGRRRLDPHQKLKHEGLLVEWNETVHSGKTIFCSHEWAGFNHPDPQRIQTLVLSNVLQHMLDGNMGNLKRAWRDNMRLGRLSTAQQMLTKGHDDIWIWLGMGLSKAASGHLMPVCFLLIAA